MSHFEKLLQKIQQATSDIRYVDLEQVVLHAGYTKVRQKGSHVHFRKQNATFITIPVHKGKVKRVYVKEICKLLDL